MDNGFCLLIGWRGSGRRHLARGGAEGRGAGTAAVGERERPLVGAAAAGGGGGGRGRGPKSPEGRYPKAGRGVSGAGTGSGRSGAVNLAGFVWFI